MKKIIYLSNKATLLLRFLCLGIGLFLQQAVSAQNHITPVSHILPDAVRGQLYNNIVDFNLVDASGAVVPANWSWSLNSTLFGLEVDNASGEVSGRVNNLAPLGIQRITVTATTSGGSVVTKEYLLNIRSASLPNCGPYEFSLVLDASGSMNTLNSTGVSRWDELKSAVGTYLPSLQNWVDPTDRIQIVTFNDGMANEHYNGALSGVNWDVLSSITPTGGTPLGAGLNTGVTMLSSPPSTPEKGIILFTDGYQNQLPLYDAAGHSIGGTPIPTDINIFSIGVSGCDQPLINAIARPTSSYSVVDLDASEMDNLFQVSIPELFRGCSPRIIDFRKGKMKGNSVVLTEQFQVDSLVRKLTVVLKTKERDARISEVINLKRGNYKVEVYPFHDGKEVRYALDLPIIPRSDPTYAIDGGGVWTLEFSGTNDAEYDLMIMVDDKYVQTNLNIANGAKVYAGDEIPVEASVTALEKPIDGLTVKAYLLRPGEDPGKLFSEVAYDPVDLQNGEVTAPGQSNSSLIAQQKVNYLLSRADVLSRLEKEKRVITLTNSANGKYTGVFPGKETEVTSFYKIMAVFDGEIRQLGALNGLEINHVYVNFSRPEDINLHQEVFVQQTANGDIKHFRLTMRPTNKFGNPIGPAQAQHIKVLVGSETLVLEDKLNGTYVAEAFSIPHGADPTVSVYVADMNTPVWSEKVIDPNGNNEKSFNLSAHAGTLMSMTTQGVLTDDDKGKYFEVDLGFQLDKNWGIELVGGKYQVEHKIDFLGGMGFLEYSFRSRSRGGLFPRIAAGIGAFRPEGADFALAVGGRAGLVFQLGARIQLSADGGIYDIPNTGYRLGYWGGGLRLLF